MFDISRYPLLSSLVVLALSMGACSPRQVIQQDPRQVTDSAPKPTSKPSPYVQGIQVKVLETFPAQANVWVQVSLPKRCQTIAAITEEQRDNYFKLNMEIGEKAGVPCTPENQEFDEIIPLNIRNLPAGVYQVEVNGKIEEFRLAVDNIY
ncbi:hypothetical protein [Thioflexithrix psekupsensis]|uniref:Lipoprotein n=1 Tax=Thioflexithrix psekupsensis TaxID=1570016 RepID=A0A251X6Z9_9GAMM|nr:hypothetical protein [Thioflexithrix psekupsensis]OUD13553.1 hypothetical protein TPSD3_10205 [Thioflexithrix psekupsensis]